MMLNEDFIVIQLNIVNRFVRKTDSSGLTNYNTRDRHVQLVQGHHIANNKLRVAPQHCQGLIYFKSYKKNKGIYIYLNIIILS